MLTSGCHFLDYRPSLIEYRQILSTTSFVLKLCFSTILLLFLYCAIKAKTKYYKTSIIIIANNKMLMFIFMLDHDVK